MNIVQMHNKVKLYLDHNRSPRYDYSKIDLALNKASIDVIKNRWEILTSNGQKNVAMQTQLLKDELYDLVKKASIGFTGNLIDGSGSDDFPDDYQFLIGVELTISGQTVAPSPLSYDHRTTIYEDPHSRPSMDYPPRTYYLPRNEGIEILFGNIGSIESANIFYMAMPQTVKIGTFKYNTETASNGDIVYFDNTVIGGATYSSGDLVSSSDTISSGAVVTGFTDPDLPKMLHEEVCKNAADLLMLSSGELQKWQAAESYDQASKQ